MQDESPTNFEKLNTESVDDIHDELDINYNEIEVITSPNTRVAMDASTSRDIMPKEHIMVI